MHHRLCYVSAMFVNIEKEKVSVCTTVFFDQESYEVDAVVRLNKKMLLTSDMSLKVSNFFVFRSSCSTDANKIKFFCYVPQIVVPLGYMFVLNI